MNVYYSFGKDTPISKLLNEIENLIKKVNEKNSNDEPLQLSRWQTNGSGGFVERITWMIHSGERKSRGVEMQSCDIFSCIYLYQIEGTTPRCTAYKKLFFMKNKLEKFLKEGIKE